MNPIATYQERLIEGEFTYTLLEDRLEVKGKRYLQAEIETEFELSSLSTTKEKVISRSDYFGRGIFWTGIAAIFGFVFMGVFEKPIASMGPTVSFIMCACGLIFTLATSKKLEHAQFRYSSGGAAFAMTKSGTKGEFESFVEALHSQIKKKAGKPNRGSS